MSPSEAIQLADRLADALLRGVMPCEHGGDKCIPAERKRLGAGHWPNFDPQRMCAPCAAYWHAASASNALCRIAPRVDAKTAKAQFIREAP